MRPHNLGNDLNNALLHKIYSDINSNLIHDKAQDSWINIFYQSPVYQHIFNKIKRQVDEDLTKINNVVESL